MTIITSLRKNAKTVCNSTIYAFDNRTGVTTMSMANIMRMTTTKSKSKSMTSLLPTAEQTLTVACFSSSSASQHHHHHHQNHYQSVYTPIQRYQQQQQQQQQQHQHIPSQERAYHNHHHRSASSSAIAHVTRTTSFCKDDIVVDPYLGNLLNGFCNGSCNHNIISSNSNNNKY
jgi:hypothetical protein